LFACVWVWSQYSRDADNHLKGRAGRDGKA
jgi:hypothetical protein